MANERVETRGASFSRACFNGVNTLLGVGLIAVPYTLAQVGWLSLCFLTLMAIITWYTATLIRRCMDSNASIRTYYDMLQLTFDKKGKLILSIMMYLELFLASTGFLILEGDNLHKLFPYVRVNLGPLQIGGKQFFTLAAGLIVLPSMWLRDLSWLSYVSAAGVFSSIVIVCSIFWVGASDGTGFSSKGELFKLTGVPTVICMYAFCYGGHSVFPPLYSSMKDKRHFSKVLLISFGLSTLCYISMAIIGYLMFGQGVSSQVTLNLPGNKLSSKIAIYTTLIGPLAKYALIVTPISIAIEACLPTRYRNKFIYILIRSLLLATSTAMALVFPYFGILMAFVGAVLNMTFSIVLPCICFLRISKTQKKWDFESIIILGITGLAILIGMLGTYTAVRDVIKV